MRHVQGADITIGANKAGWIHDPAINELFQFLLFPRIERACSAQRVQVAVGVQPQLGG